MNKTEEGAREGARVREWEQETNSLVTKINSDLVI